VLWHAYKTHKYAVLAERGNFNAERDGRTDRRTVHKVTAGLLMAKEQKRVGRQNNCRNQKAFCGCVCNGLLIGSVVSTF
jgi:hypothetical protein